MMKKTVLTMAALFAGYVLTFAQNPEAWEDKFTFYGIDFSLARVVGASESEEEFIEAFKGINGLFLSEPEKYVQSLATRMKKEITAVDIDPVLAVIDEIDTEEIKINKTAELLSEDDLKYALLGLDIKPDNGLGLLVVCGGLDKGTEYGTFYYVIFDNRDMSILDTWASKGKSGGIGLCNYWARSFYRTIAEINPSKFYQAKKKVKDGLNKGVETIRSGFEKKDKE
ncbi:MAG: hypothetical protein ACI3Y9_09840 [Candidatus Cryptobacteroides sp.]